MIVKCLDDFLPLRNVNDLEFTVLNKETDEKLLWYIEDVLDEINRDRSEKWIDYSKNDWFEGWAEWCEDDIYTILSIEDKEDKVYRPFL